MTNQEQYEIIWDKANKYDKLVKVLDEIKDEIKQLTSRYTISRERGGMGQVEWSDRLIKEDDVLQIIDKYKADKEE